MKRLIAVLLSALLLWVPASMAFAAAPVSKSAYYARSTLKGKELAFYDALYAAIANNRGLSAAAYGIKDDRVREIAQYVYNDAPELFNRNGYLKGSEANKLNEQLFQKTKQILALISDDMSQYEKVKTVYLYLGKHMTYDDDAAKDIESGIQSPRAYVASTVIGGILNEKAVCGGIAASLQYLLYHAGIRSYVVSGWYAGGYHAWNLIQIDGDWFYADLTNDSWDIANDMPVYFLYDDTFLKTHTVDAGANPALPACVSDEYMEKSLFTNPGERIFSFLNANATYIAAGIFGIGLICALVLAFQRKRM